MTISFNSRRHTVGLGAILGAAIISLTAPAFAYPAVVNQGMTILKPGAQPGYVIFAAPDLPMRATVFAPIRFSGRRRFPRAG
jgi:hypothetical protein